MDATTASVSHGVSDGNSSVARSAEAAEAAQTPEINEGQVLLEPGQVWRSPRGLEYQILAPTQWSRIFRVACTTDGTQGMASIGEGWTRVLQEQEVAEQCESKSLAEATAKEYAAALTELIAASGDLAGEEIHNFGNPESRICAQCYRGGIAGAQVVHVDGCAIGRVVRVLAAMEKLRSDVAGVEVAAIGAGAPRTFMIDAFLDAVNDIGRYGHEKYGADSFQTRRRAGDRSRGALPRTTPTAIRGHAVAHFSEYCSGVKHDRFGTLKHQLAAVAFNAMMEFYFADLEHEVAEPVAESDESWEASEALLRHTPKCGVLSDDESAKCTLAAGHAGDEHYDRVTGARFARADGHVETSVQGQL